MTSPENGTPPQDGVERLGTVISGRYLIRELLGEGGMGSVYLAEHTHMKKRVALKLLHPEMSDNAEVQARFEREAMASAHIEHPNVAAATDFGRTEDGAYFLVLEYVEGTSLRDALEAGPLSVQRALRITRQMALALERAHESGIVHRDLKPENVMLVKREDEPDFVKVLDFGIAKVLELGAASASGDVAKRNSVGQPLTRLGTILGTPEYMAPEQALGEAVTPAADLYGVGVMLYEMLTGLHPFDPPDRTAMLSFHIVAPVPLMQDRAPAVDVPATVEAVVRCLLEKDSKKRYPSARALIEAIDSAAKTSGIDLGGPTKAAHPAPSEPRPWSPPDAFAHTSVGTPAPSIPTSKDGPPASVRTHDGSARTSVTETLRRQPRRLLIAVAAALPVGFILVIAAVLLVGRRHAPATLEGGASSVAPEVRATTAPAERVKAAEALGPDAIEALVKEFPQDAALPAKLAVAYQSQGRTADALRTVRALVTASPAAATDDELLQLVTITAAKGKGDDDDEAFALLEGPFGERGVDALVELTTAKAATRAVAERLHARAARSLAKPEVRAHATPAVSVLLDVKAAPTCVAKRELLPRAKEIGDARMAPLLKSFKATRGCGFLGRADCFPCLRREPALDEAIEAVEARPAPK
ncbi:MAG TPA: protein kinase [Labilithrix sp.]|nr:protein kinase [Labilithrix sp.]